MNWKLVAAPAIGIPIIGLLAFGLTRDPTNVPSPLVGRDAPDFNLQTLKGDSIALDDLKGQPVVVNFWASWCIPCAHEHPLLVAAERRWHDKGLRIVGVVFRDTKNNAEAWLSERGGNWPNVLDPDSKTAITYGLFAVPETFFVNRQGRVVFKQIGPLSEQVLERWIPVILTAKEN